MISDGTDLWVANSTDPAGGNGTITKISLATHQSTVLRSSLLSTPAGLASNGTDLFILGGSSNAQPDGYVVEMNIATGAFKEIDSPTFYDPTEIVASAGYAYVTNSYGGPSQTGSLSQIDLSTGAVTEIDSLLFNQPGALVLTPGTLWIADSSGGTNNTGALLEMDLATSTISEVDNAAFSNPFALATDGTQVVVLNATAAPSSPSVSVLTIASGTIATDTSAALAGASGVALDANNIWIVTTTGGTYGDGSLVDLSRGSTAHSVVNSSLFVSPSLIATGAGQVFVIGSTTFSGMFAGTSEGDLVDINPNGTATHYGAGPLPPSNPSANMVTNPQYNGGGYVCAYSAHYVYKVTTACTAEMLQAINNAHAVENVKPMVLPTNWNSLTVPEQIYVVITLERVDRGLAPYLGINAALSGNAQAAAVAGHDPSLARGFPGVTSGDGGIWAGDYSPLSADFGWMYNDGWGGSLMTTTNGDCSSAKAPPCWGHRDQILGADPGWNPGVGLGCTTCEVGVGYSFLARYRWGSYVGLIERPIGPPPAMIFTWAKNVAPYLPAQ
jgi:hypothetical protein